MEITLGAHVLTERRRRLGSRHAVQGDPETHSPPNIQGYTSRLDGKPQYVKRVKTDHLAMHKAPLARIGSVTKR